MTEHKYATIMAFVLVIEAWLGRTAKVAAGSILELIFNLLFKSKTKEIEMELTKGVTLDYTGGQIVLKADVAPVVNKVIDDLKAKIESGEVDPIKGTDFDKDLILQALSLLADFVNPKA